MRLSSIALLCGTWLILSFAHLPSLLLSGMLVVIFLVSYYFKPKPLLLFLLITSAGFFYANWEAHQRLSWTLPNNLENKVLVVQGKIISIPETDGMNTSFLFHIEHFDRESLKPVTVKLSWFNDAPSLVAGDHWQLAIKLKRIHGFADPGAFDYEEYALSHGIRAQGYVRSEAENKLLTSSLSEHWLNRVRQHIEKSIQISLPHSDYAAMIVALSVGIKTGIQANQWQVLQKTGTNHLMVIAGLHVGMLSGLFFFMVGFLWRRSARLPLLIPTPQVATLGALFIALTYSALAGFSIPTQRALVMIAVFMFSTLFQRNIALGLAWCLALFIVLVLDPFATMEVGFWLSFAAVGTILYGMSGRLFADNWWWKWGRIQWIISMGIIPFTLLLFQNASIISPIANSISIPIVGFIVVPLSLLGSFVSFISLPAASVIWHIAVFVLAGVWWILKTLAALPASSWQQAVTTTWSLVAAVFGVALLLAPRGFPARWVGIIFCLPILIFKPASPAFGTAKLTLLDVGQGLASVIQTQHHTLVFDTGARFSPDFDLGQAIVVPFLRTQGIGTVDKMVISHGDNDHIGGAESVIQFMHVLEIDTSVPDKFKGLNVKTCLAGQQWEWDGVSFEFLYPDKHHLDLGNNSSCVLMITAGNEHILMTGDIEKPAEVYLVDHDKRLLKANVLIAPHHGSRTSSTPDFLMAVHPEYVLYPMGYLNKFHFPNQDVMQRYNQIGAKSFQSDKDGAISLVIGENQAIDPLGYRESHQRFWG
jgi:competence protein ComEC